MPRPVKWSRDLYPVRERAAHSRTETWSRRDIEHLFGVGRVAAQSLMKAIGDIASVGAAHFVDRTSLLRFLDEMIAAPSVEQGLKERMLDAEPLPKSRPLRVSLPASLKSSMMVDLPSNIEITAGQILITASSAVAALQSLCTLALIMQNDFGRFQNAIEPAPAPPQVEQADWERFFTRVRDDANT